MGSPTVTILQIDENMTAIVEKRKDCSVKKLQLEGDAELKIGKTDGVVPLLMFLAYFEGGA